MRLTRFERKILATMAAVALVPLLAALLLGREALREAYHVGVNERVHAQLEQGLAMYRAHFTALRADAERTADAVAYHHALHQGHADGDQEAVARLLDSLLSRYPTVAAAALRDPDGVVLATAERRDRLDLATMRLLTQRRPLGDEGHVVEVTIATPVDAFQQYQRAGEVEEVYGRLRASAAYVSTSYLIVYIAFLLSVIVITLALGFVLSRRVTRRVGDLAEAAREVGAGDLDVVVATDARDEVGELTRAFNEMVRDLRESRERIDYLSRIGAWQQFARRLAHEIKNPLTPIQLAAQEMRQGYGGDDPTYRRKLEDAASIIQEEVATLRRLVGEFSSFAKLPEASLAQADLGGFLQDLERNIPAILDDEGVTPDAVQVRCEAPPEPLPVAIDAMMLKRCVDNLVRNAVQAVRQQAPPEGGQVVLGVRREAGEALLEVRDNGPGIPSEHRGRVFDPYFTTRSEGTGLGLAIVKKVVLEHGGRIECDASPEGGALFRVRIPLHGGGKRGRSHRAIRG
jgi:two-component system, NtrC family, nitrogen regulation sensor histidine kinase NtrY